MEKLEKYLEMVTDPHNWAGAGFYAVVFLLSAIFVSRLIPVASRRVLLRDGQSLVDPTVVLFLTQLAQISVYVIGLIIFFHIVPALNKLGTALLTGVSVASVVFGLAAQNTLSNLVAGLTLLLYRPFHIDDLIQVASPTGTEIGVVERLTLGYTMLRTLDDRLVVVPNSLMASQVSLNLNRRSLHIMANVPVSVRDSDKNSEVRHLLLDSARADKKIHKIIGVNTQHLDDGGSVLTLRAWCANTPDAEEVQSNISAAIHQRFSGDVVVPRALNR